jgi:hypothetical protein
MLPPERQGRGILRAGKVCSRKNEQRNSSERRVKMVGRGRPRRAVTHSSVEEKKIEPQMDVNERR